MNKHEAYMAQCLKLASLGTGSVSPNPLVGCIIVKDGKVLGTGFHKKAGENHAEIEAIENTKGPIEGATVYCNLEPCCHTNKKTPPCAQRLISEKVKTVIIANLDPNPEVSGKGVELLKEAGIEVITGILATEGEKLNEIFFTNMRKNKAFIKLKMAQTLDGNIATSNGGSKWITSDNARAQVHKERNKFDAIMIGPNTANMDNPKLTVRIDGNERPIKRIILTANQSVKNSINLLNDEYKEYTYLVVPEGHKSRFEGIKTIHCPRLANGQFDLNKLAEILLTHGIVSVYVEGGKTVHTSFLSQKAFDAVDIFMAPKMIGTGMQAIGDLGVHTIEDAFSFERPSWKVIGEEVIFSAYKSGELQ